MSQNDHRAAGPTTSVRMPPALTGLVWVALALAPVLFLVETSGPRWLNLFLRGLWVGIVAVAAGWVLLRLRPARTGDGVRR